MNPLRPLCPICQITMSPSYFFRTPHHLDHCGVGTCVNILCLITGFRLGGMVQPALMHNQDSFPRPLLSSPSSSLSALVEHGTTNTHRGIKEGHLHADQTPPRRLFVAAKHPNIRLWAAFSPPSAPPPFWWLHLRALFSPILIPPFDGSILAFRINNQSCLLSILNFPLSSPLMAPSLLDPSRLCWMLCGLHSQYKRELKTWKKTSRIFPPMYLLF